MSIRSVIFWLGLMPTRIPLRLTRALPTSRSKFSGPPSSTPTARVGVVGTPRTIRDSNGGAFTDDTGESVGPGIPASGRRQEEYWERRLGSEGSCGHIAKLSSAPST